MGSILDEDQTLTLQELCEVCGTQSSWILELVQEGVVEPMGQQQSEWQFSASCLPRVHTALRLSRDLGVNLAGAALALQLLDEIDKLQARVQMLSRCYDFEQD